ncbi:alpha/beta-hydrolase [Mycena filopes]|nr:alpha/beta-hydrolase [Mycena filopes]
MAQRRYEGNYARWRFPPAKQLYLLYQLLTVALIRLPYWAITAAPRAWRPRKSWTWKRTIQVHLIRHVTSLSQIVGPLLITPSHLALVPGTGFHGLWVEPVPADLVIGQLQVFAGAAGVFPVKLPGYWLHKVGSTIEFGAPLMPGEKIVYILHGGAFIRLSAHPSDMTAAVARGLLERVDSVHRTFSIEYRDSAGGNLALALTRYLVENAIPSLPPPALLILLSPWADLGTSHAYPGSSYYTCLPSDYISITTTSSLYPIVAFSGPFGLGALDLNPYISPASTYISSISFARFPPTFISAGGAEILRDSIRTLRQRMAKDMGDQVRYLEAEDGVHDFVVFDGSLHDPERTDTLTAIAEWVAERS